MYPQQIYKFCTIFDLSYYTKGLALYYSLEAVCDFHLYIFTPEKQCYDLLLTKNLTNATVILFEEFENEKLLNVKQERDKAEYYWTVKASCIKYLFENMKIDLISYVDADTFFYSTPQPIIKELENHSVLLLPHNFSSKYSHELKNGIFNAGFISFKNDGLGIKALNWWNEKNIEWCFRKKEDEKFGDQMYLNTMINFDGVTSLKHKGALANWNVQQYKFERRGENIIGVTAKGEIFDVIFFHFHYLKFYNTKEVELGRKFIPKCVLDLFYKPYISYLLMLAPEHLQGMVSKPLNWKTPIIYLKRKLQRSYNVFKLPLENI